MRKGKLNAIPRMSARWLALHRSSVSVAQSSALRVFASIPWAGLQFAFPAKHKTPVSTKSHLFGFGLAGLRNTEISMPTIQTTLLAPAFFSAVLLLAGCQPVANVKPVLPSNDSSTSRVFIYRPSSDWAGVAIDFRTTVNGGGVGALGSGKSVSAVVQPGTVVVKVQDYFLGIAGSQTAEFRTTVSAREDVYLRFSQRINAIIPAGSGAAIEGSLVLQPVSEAQYEEGR